MSLNPPNVMYAPSAYLPPGNKRVFLDAPTLNPTLLVAVSFL